MHKNMKFNYQSLRSYCFDLTTDEGLPKVTMIFLTNYYSWKLWNIIILFTLCFLGLFPCIVHGNVFDQFTRFIEERIQSDNIPGVAVAVVEGNHVVFIKGFGYRDLEAKLPVTSETLFHIGSNTKSMTALMVAAIVDENLANWDTPVIEYYSGFKLQDPITTKQVTFRHLLSMRAGIPADAENDLLESDVAKDIFDIIEYSEILGYPGNIFDYSNLSSTAAGYIAAIISGHTLDTIYDGYIQLLMEKILHPIGMTHAYVRVSEARKNDNYGKSYIMNNNVLEVAISEDFDGDPLAPSGSLKASVSEMALYLSMLLNRGVAPNGNRVISSENLTETWKTYLENYGMGFEKKTYNGITIFGHEGSFDNYLSVFGISMDLNMGYIILTNCEDVSETLISDAPEYLVDLYKTNKEIVKGDTDGSRSIDLKDVILALQMSLNHTFPVNLNADIDLDHRIGIVEAIFVMKMISEM
jgi:CubicO group peptidase (beta-lactamase class C family)